MVHTFELSRMIGKETFEMIIDSLNMKPYNKNLWITHDYQEQGFTVIKLHKIKRKAKNCVSDSNRHVSEDGDITHYYMISFLVNTGIMFHGDRHLSNNILSYTPDLERAIIYNLLEIIPCLEVYPELRNTDLDKWHKYNTYKLRRIDFAFDIKKNNQEYLKLLNSGYTLRNKYYIRNYYDRDKELEDIQDDEPDNADSTEEGISYTSSIQYIYYKGKSINVNIYHKGREIEKEKLTTNDNVDYDFVRLEVQVKKNKLNAIVKKFGLIGRELPYIAIPEIELYVLNYYIQAITGKGVYVTLDQAKRVVNKSTFREDKKTKLIKVLEEIAVSQSVAKFLNKVEIQKLTYLGKFSTVKKYLRDIQSLGINPLTISTRMAKSIQYSYFKNIRDGSDLNEKMLPNITDMFFAYNEQIKDELQNGRAYQKDELEIL